MTALLEYLDLEKWRDLAPSKIEVDGLQLLQPPTLCYAYEDQCIIMMDL